MFGISKKKLIENYEKQIKQKNERIKDLNEDKKKLIMNYENQMKQKSTRIGELIKDNEELKKENSRISDRYLKTVVEADNLKQANAVLDEMTDEMIKEIDLLVDKKIKRLEAIKARTKKHKIKKKCDNKILQLEKRYL